MTEYSEKIITSRHTLLGNKKSPLILASNAYKQRYDDNFSPLRPCKGSSVKSLPDDFGGNSPDKNIVANSRQSAPLMRKNTDTIVPILEGAPKTILNQASLLGSPKIQTNSNNFVPSYCKSQIAARRVTEPFYATICSAIRDPDPITKARVDAFDAAISDRIGPRRFSIHSSQHLATCAITTPLNASTLIDSDISSPPMFGTILQTPSIKPLPDPGSQCVGDSIALKGRSCSISSPNSLFKWKTATPDSIPASSKSLFTPIDFFEESDLIMEASSHEEWMRRIRPVEKVPQHVASCIHH